MKAHGDSEHAGLTWLEPEELTYPSGGFLRRALVEVRPNPHNPLRDLPIGSLRIARCSIADTYFTIPARMRLNGATLKGFVSVDTEKKVFTFTPNADPTLCTMCAEGEGCKTRAS